MKKEVFVITADVIKSKSFNEIESVLKNKLDKVNDIFKGDSTMTITELYEKTLKKYGQERQLDKSIEELSELIKAICKYKNCSSNEFDKRINDIIEEIADVEIMLEQLKLIFSSSEKVLFVKIGKQKRLERRILE